MPEFNNDNVCHESVFEKLFKSLAPEVRNFLLFKFRDIERANDIVQEAFIIMWNNCHKVPAGLAKSYLYKVAQNQFIKLLDKDKVRQKHLELQTDTTHIEDPAFTLEHKELSEKLKTAIEQLPDGQREVFLMNRLENKTYAEIAVILGVSVKAIEKRMHHALVKLRTICEKI